MGKQPYPSAGHPAGVAHGLVPWIDGGLVLHVQGIQGEEETQDSTHACGPATHWGNEAESWGLQARAGQGLGYCRPGPQVNSGCYGHWCRVMPQHKTGYLFQGGGHPWHPSMPAWRGRPPLDRLPVSMWIHPADAMAALLPTPIPSTLVSTMAVLTLDKQAVSICTGGLRAADSPLCKYAVLVAQLLCVRPASTHWTTIVRLGAGFTPSLVLDIIFIISLAHLEKKPPVLPLRINCSWMPHPIFRLEQTNAENGFCSLKIGSGRPE